MIRVEGLQQAVDTVDQFNKLRVDRNKLLKLHAAGRSVEISSTLGGDRYIVDAGPALSSPVIDVVVKLYENEMRRRLDLLTSMGVDVSSMLKELGR